MSAVPIPTANPPKGSLETAREGECSDWMRVGVGGTLLTGSILLLTGKRKAGLLVTAAGTALALLQEQETVRAWWNALPEYLDNAQKLLDQAQTTIDDISAKRERLRAFFGK